MWTRPSSKRDSTSSTASHKRKSESGSKSSRSRRERSPSHRSSRTDDRDDDARTTAGSVVSAPRTEYSDTSTYWSAKKQYETSEDAPKSRRRDRDDSSSFKRESSRSLIDGNQRRGDEDYGERKKSSSGSKDKARTRAYTTSDDEDEYRSRAPTERRRSAGTSRALDSTTASAVPNQFPGQVPLDYSTSAFEGSGYVGAAADYYGDHNAYLHAVAMQPGVRPSTPIVMGTEPHLMAPLAEAAPPPETGAGAAADFYSGNDYVQQPSGVSQKPSRPGRLSSTSVLAGAAGLATGATLLSQSSSSNRPPSSTRPSSSKPSRQSSQGSNAGMLALGAAGAAGLTAAEIHHHHQHHRQDGRPQSSVYGSVPAYATVSNRRQKGTMDKFVDWWKDYEDVRKFEEYTEYIGICKYCFDPNSSVWEAPRAHRPSRRSSREFQNRTRVDKDTRYHVSDDESRVLKRASVGLAAGVAAGLVGQSTVQAIRSKRESKEYEDYRSRKAGNREPGATPITRGTEEIYLERRSSRRSSRDHEHSKHQQSTSSKAQIMKAGAGAAALGAIAASSSRRKPLVEGSPRSSRSSSTSDEQPSGFFAKLFSPNTIKTRKVRRRRSGRFYGLDNASIDTGLAYGAGASTLSLAPKPSRRHLRRRSSDIDPAKTLLALGGATAALAATQAASSSRREVFASREPRHGIPPPIQRVEKHKRKQHDEDWESASDDDDAQSVDSGLAFGHTILPSSSSDSLSSAASGTNKWGWRWGSGTDKGSKQRRPRTSQVSKNAMELAGGVAMLEQSESVAPSQSQSRNSSSRRISSTAPMQVVDPMPASDLGYQPRFDPRRQVDGRPILTSPPRDVPIQQPKPRSPPKSVPFAPPGATQAGALDFLEQSRRHRSNSTTPPKSQDTSIRPLSRVFTEPIASSGRGTATSARRRRRSSGGADLQDVALAGGVAAVAAGAYVMSRRRSETTKSHPIEQKPALRQDSDDSEAERLERERRREKRRQDRASQSAIVHAPEDREANAFPAYVDSSSEPASHPEAYSKSETTITPSESASQAPSRRQYSVEHYEVTPETAASKATEPVFDDDVDDPNFFKKRNRVTSEPRDVDDTSKVFNDFNARYAEKPTTQAEFFAPTEILNGPSPVSTREADFNVEDQNDQGSSRIDVRSAVPRLNIIAPTPPGSVSGRSGKRSASTSPMRQSTTVDDASEEDFIASRVRWGDSEVNIYQVESPESFREQEYFPETGAASNGLSKGASAGQIPSGNATSEKFENSDIPPDSASTPDLTSPKRQAIPEASGDVSPSNNTSHEIGSDKADQSGSVFDYQISAPDTKELSKETLEDEDWAPVSKKSKKDKKSKRKSQGQGLDTVVAREPQGQVDIIDSSREPQRERDSVSTVGTGPAASAFAMVVGAAIKSNEDRDGRKANYQSSTSGASRSMPGSFDPDVYPEEQPATEIEPQVRDSKSRDGQDALEQQEGNRQFRDSGETHQDNTHSDISQSAHSTEAGAAEWNELSGKKKKSKKEKRRSERQDIADTESLETFKTSLDPIAPEVEEWDIPVSSKKKKKDKKAKRASKLDNNEQSPSVTATPSENELDDQREVPDQSANDPPSPEAHGTTRAHFADIVSSVATKEGAETSRSSPSDNDTAQSSRATRYAPSTNFADVVSSVSAPVFSTGKRDIKETEGSSSASSVHRPLSDPEDDSRSHKGKKQKSRSYEPLDLAQADDYSFRASSVEMTNTDSLDADRKSSKKEKKEKKGIFSFLDRKPSEDVRTSKSHTGADTGAGDNGPATTENSRKSKRRSTGDFDDESTISRHSSRSSRPRNDSPARSRSSTGRRQSTDYETGTSSRTKVNTKSQLDVYSGTTLSQTNFSVG